MNNLLQRLRFLPVLFIMLMNGATAHASGQAMVNLGTASNFAVLAGSTITNTGLSTITGDLGLSPGSSVTGFPPGVVNGTQHIADAVALQAGLDLVTAYNDAAGRSPATLIATELGGSTLLPGVYAAGTFQITGTLTLDAQGDPSAVWILQSASTLITASNSNVVLINGAQPCNVFWQVTSSATLGTGTNFKGDILALASITLNTGAETEGRLLARNGAVTVDSGMIKKTTCAALVSTSSSLSSSTSSVPVNSSSLSSLSSTSSNSSSIFSRSSSLSFSLSSFSASNGLSSSFHSSFVPVTQNLKPPQLPSSGSDFLLGIILTVSFITTVLFQLTRKKAL